MDNWLDYEVLGDTLLAWGTAAAVFLVLWLAVGLARRLIRSRLATLAGRSGHASLLVAEQAVSATKGWFLLVAAFFIATRLLALTPAAHGVIVKVATLALLLQIGLWATAAVGKSLALRRERQLDEGRQTVAALDIIGFLLRLAVWSVILLVMLENLGLDVTAMIAGLGIGGIAIALATQNILGDLFASLSIVLDKPFVVGDFLAVGEYVGNVEKVGVKTTRLRSLSGEQLIFSNNDLLSSRIRNYGRMYQRRVVFSIGVSYRTSTEQLQRIPVIIREAIEAQENVRFDRAHFQKYDPYALVFEAVYFVLSADYNLYVDVEQKVNLVIHERFTSEDIEFARSTRLDVEAPEAESRPA